MAKQTITIRDVASQAGVSPGTVSHVLNNNLQHVSPATHERVLEAIKSLNYRPNAIARSMVKRATRTIGLVITELSNPLFVPVTEGVEEVLRKEGYQIVLASAGSLESELRAIETLRTQQVDGFIFMSLSVHFPTEHLKKLQAEGIPFVIINRDLDDPGFNLVKMDDLGGGRTATLHLTALGHSRIGVINGPREVRRSARERFGGWQQIMTEKKLTIKDEWILEGNFTFEGGYQAIQELLKRTDDLPTVFFATNESMAVGAIKAIFDGGLRVPHDIAIATIGDPPFAAYTHPALTTLTYPVVEAGRVATRILVDNLKSGVPVRPQHVTLSYSLKVRESCGANLK